MSREALALDISRVVSRVVSGEDIDTAERGAALAAKYPDLGMSGELIGEAIARAAGMVGLIRSAPPPQKASLVPPKPAKIEPAAPVMPAAAIQPAVMPSTPAAAAPPPTVPASAPAVFLSIDDDLAAAIDAEIGNLVTGRKAEPDARPSANGNGHAPAEAEHASAATGPNGTAPQKGPLSALRRVFFRG